MLADDTILPPKKGLRHVPLAALPQGYITFGSTRKGHGRVWHKAAQANVAGVSAASET
jgi:hypothetical protein